ncbi:MAG: type II secretion system protein [Desulfosoma sp.]
MPIRLQGRMFSHKPKTFSKSVSGFSLLEVLVALTIMGITLAVIFYGFSQSARLRLQAQKVLEASRVARIVLADSVLLTEAVRRGVMEGPVDGEPGWFYRLEARPLVLSLGRDMEAYEDPNMVQLTLCVFEESQSSRRSRCLVGWYERKG